MDVFEMNRNQFITALSELTTPEAVYINAGNPYDFLTILFNQNCMDSVLREWAFEWASEQLALEYDVIYDRWLDQATYHG